MRLAVALPHRIAVYEPVQKVRGEGLHGSFTLLPRHLDYVILLQPGILSYLDAGGREKYVAVDGGVLTKVGERVRVATTAAVQGELADLQQTVTETFRQLDEREQAARRAQAHIETHLIQEMLEFEDPQ